MCLSMYAFIHICMNLLFLQKKETRMIKQKAIKMFTYRVDEK